MGDAEVVDIPEQPAIEAPEFEEPVEHEDVSEQVITPEPKVEPGEAAEPGPKDVADALKALKQLDPKYAKIVDRMRKDFFETGQFRESFPSAREAKIAKMAWDSVGGETGFADLREKEQWIQWVDEAAEAGDSSIVDDWSKDFPDGFRQAMPYASKKWAQMDPQGFQQAIAPHFSGFLDRAQLGDRLSEAYDAIAANNPQGAQSLLKNIYAWVQAQRQYGAEGGQPNASPAEDKLAQREKALRDKEETAFRGEIGRETFRYQQDSVQKALNPYLRGQKISEQARTRLVATINSDIENTLLRDEGFQRQMTAYLAKHDSDGTKNYLKGHLDTIIPSISKRAWQDLYGPLPKGAKAGALAGLNNQNGRKSSPSGPIRLSQKPAVGDIEKNPGYMEAYITGQAIMAKGPYKGKLVKWK